jgi:biotin synthase
MPMKSIVMNGLGFSEDLIKSIVYLRRFKNISSLWITTFTPIRGTPWAERQPASVWDSLKAMAITRLLLPDADVNLGFGGGGNLMPMILMAGGGNIFMSMMKDHGKQTDNRASINSYASSLGFNVRLNVA